MVKKLASISIDEQIDKQIRKLQAKILSSTNENWSYSAVLGELVKEGLKTTKHDKKFNRRVK